MCCMRAGFRMRALLLLALSVACQAAFRNAESIAVDPHWVDSSGATDSGAIDANSRAIEFLRSRETEAGLLKLQEAVELDPGFAPAALNLAHLYVLLEETASAREVYGQFIAATASDDVLFQIGQDLEEQRRTEEARTFFEGCVAAGRLSPESSLWLGAEALRQQEYARAARFYDLAFAAAPEDVRGIFGLALLRFMARDWQAALPLLQDARQAGSEEPSLPYLLARTHYELGNVRQTVEIARSAAQAYDIELVQLHGRALLVLDYRADLSPLLEGVPDRDRETLLRSWYGEEDLRDNPELYLEFQQMF